MWIRTRRSSRSAYLDLDSYVFCATKVYGPLTYRKWRVLEYRRYFGDMQERFPEFKKLCDEHGDNIEIMCGMGDEVSLIFK